MIGDATLPASPDQLLTPARAAALAERSVKTIRRAYTSGRLTAFRDGAGRGVRIRYGDLRGWMISEEIVSARARPRAGKTPATGSTPDEHLAMIRAARRRGSS